MHRLSQFWPSMRANHSAHRWVAPAPTHHLHVFPGLHGVVPEHAPLALRNRWMRPHPAIRAQDDPLAMSSRVVIAEPHQQLRITIHQPTLPSWFLWGFMSGAIAIRHWWSLALIRFAPCARKVSGERSPAVDQLLMVNLSSCPKRKTLVPMGYIELDLIGRSLPDFRTFSQGINESDR